MIVEILGWNMDQWDCAFLWYKNLVNVPKLPTDSEIKSGSERYLAVQREWAKRGLPISGPEIIKFLPDVTPEIIDLTERLAKLDAQRVIQQMRAIYEKLHEKETDAVKKACYVQFINSLDEICRSVFQGWLTPNYIIAGVK
jgi:hypothetical protein